METRVCGCTSSTGMAIVATAMRREGFRGVRQDKGHEVEENCGEREDVGRTRRWRVEARGSEGSDESFLGS